MIPGDPRSEAATILSKDAQPVVDFAKGERARKDQLKAQDDLLAFKKDQAVGKVRGNNLDRLSDKMPDYWTHYQKEIGAIQDDYLSKYSNLLHNSPTGRLEYDQERDKHNDIARIKQIADQSLALKSAWEKGSEDINDPLFDNPENRAKLEDVRNPYEHAERNGMLDKLEELGPVTYAYEEILKGQPLLTPNIDAFGYIKENYLEDLKRNYELSIADEYTNPQGGYSKTKVESFSPEAIEKDLLGKYETDKTFSNLIDRLAVKQAGETGKEPQELIPGIINKLANDFGYGERIVESKDKANPAKDNDFTMRYISNKNGKKTVTKEFEDGVARDTKVRVSKDKFITSPFTKNTEDLEISMPAGSLADGATNSYIKGSGNYVLGAGQLFIDPDRNVWWKGTATTKDNEDTDRESKDVMVKAKHLDHPQVRAASEALLIMLEQQLNEIPD